MIKSMDKQDKLTIGRLAKLVGVNIETIRYYQRIGLIDEPTAPLNGFWQYPVKTAENITFIKRAQRLGFSLKEIAELLKIGDGNCDNVRTRAEKKRNKIEDQIRDLQSLRDTLNKLICECECNPDKNSHHCPIVETLLEHDDEILWMSALYEILNNQSVYPMSPLWWSGALRKKLWMSAMGYHLNPK